MGVTGHHRSFPGGKGYIWPKKNTISPTADFTEIAGDFPDFSPPFLVKTSCEVDII